MAGPRNSALRWAVVALVASTWIAACTVEPRRGPPPVEGELSRTPGVMSIDEAERARARVTVGKSSKADVVSALGKAAAMLAFDSGFEVWVYRIRAPDKAKQGDAELVMLFAPSGILAKTRLRSAASAG